LSAADKERSIILVPYRMFRRSTIVLPNVSGARLQDESRLFSIFFLNMACGILLGCLFGLYSTDIPSFFRNDSWIFSVADFSAPGAVILYSCRFLVAAVFFSSCLFGMVLLPVTVFVRGFSLGCAVAVVYSCFRFAGAAKALLCFGIPALIEVPIFLRSSVFGFRFSASLFPFSASHGHGFSSGSIFQAVCMVLFSITLNTLYILFLLPVLLQ